MNAAFGDAVARFVAASQAEVSEDRIEEGLEEARSAAHDVLEHALPWEEALAAFPTEAEYLEFLDDCRAWVKTGDLLKGQGDA